MRGFTLPELLVAMLLSMVVSGTLFRILDASQLVVAPQLEAADVQQRLRVALDAMLRDLLMAGAARTDDGAAWQTAAVLPYRHGAVQDDPGRGVFYRADAITVLYIPSSAEQSTPVSHTYYAKADASGALQLMHYNGASGDFPVIDNVTHLSFAYFGDPHPPTLLSAPDAGSDPDPLDEYGAGENCLFVRVDGEAVPRLPTLSTANALELLSAASLIDGPWCPNGAAAARFDADLLRIRRIRVRVRVQAGAAAFRGPAGVLFTRQGTAAGSLRLVPDRELAFDVSPRNLNAGR